jgi:hypothetical protein
MQLLNDFKEMEKKDFERHNHIWTQMEKSLAKKLRTCGKSDCVLIVTIYCCFIHRLLFRWAHNHRTVGSVMNTKLEGMCKYVFTVQGCMMDFKTTTATAVTMTNLPSRTNSNRKPKTSIKLTL